MAETHAQMVQIQFVKQPLIMVNFSSKGFKTVVIRELVMAAILFFKMNDKVFKSKHHRDQYLTRGGITFLMSANAKVVEVLDVFYWAHRQSSTFSVISALLLPRF